MHDCLLAEGLVPTTWVWHSPVPREAGGRWPPAGSSSASSQPTEALLWRKGPRPGRTRQGPPVPCGFLCPRSSQESCAQECPPVLAPCPKSNLSLPHVRRDLGHCQRDGGVSLKDTAFATGMTAAAGSRGTSLCLPTGRPEGSVPPAPAAPGLQSTHGLAEGPRPCPFGPGAVSCQPPRGCCAH